MLINSIDLTTNETKLLLNSYWEDREEATETKPSPDQNCPTYVT